MVYKDKEKQKEYHKIYYQLNKEKYKLRQDKCIKENYKKFYDRHALYRLKNHDKIKAKARLKRESNKKVVLSYYSNDTLQCKCCKEGIYEFLTIDHINNNGKTHRKDNKYNTGAHTYIWLINNNFPEGFQVLCYNCNCAKGVFGICPHQNQISY